MAGVFVNYRRDDRSVAAPVIARAARQHFGADAVFLDTSMEPGTHYPQRLEQRLRDCDVLVVVIQDTWLTALRAKARERKDWVRHEIVTALAAGKQIVPVLVGPATPLRPEDLPIDLLGLANLQTARLRPDTLDDDLDVLIRLLERYVRLAGAPTPAQPRGRRPTVGFAALARRIAVWSTLAVLAPLAFLLARGVVSSVALLAFAIVSVLFGCVPLFTGVLLLALRRPILRWERKASARPFADSLVTALAVAPFVVVWEYVWVRHATADFSGMWALLPPVAVAAAVTWYLARMLYRLFRVDRTARSTGLSSAAWSRRRYGRLDPYVWRRAARGLYDRLTESPDWRWPRTRAGQDRIVDEYFALAEVRAAMLASVSRRRRQWLAEDHARFAVVVAVWAAVTWGLVLCAVIERFLAGAGPVRLVVVAAVALVVIGGVAMVGLWLGHRVESERDGRLAEELAGWQARIGPHALVRPEDLAEQPDHDGLS